VLTTALALTLLFAACDNPTAATEDTTPPAAVTGLTAVAEIDQVTLSWTNPTDEDFAHVLITFTPEAASVDQPIMVSRGTTNKLITPLANGTEYTFTIVAVDASGNESSAVETEPVTPGDITPPANVTGQTAEAGNGQITLAWTDPADLDLATIEITFDPPVEGVEQPITAPKGAQRRVITGLANGTEYTFTLVAVDGFGNESLEPHPFVTETPDEEIVNDTTPPLPATGFAAIAGDRQAALTWIDPADADFHHVEITFTPAVEGIGQPISVAKGTQNRIIEGLANGTPYTFTITALDTSDNRSEVATASATPEDTTPPANVAGLAAEAGDGQAILTWTNPADADFDHVEITFIPVVGTQPITVAKGTQTQTITGLANGTRYTFTVITVDASANKSDGSTASATPVVPPSTDKKAAELIAEGSALLVAQSFDGAVDYYEGAYTAESDDPGAIVYSSIAKLASIAKDQKVQDLMKNRFGLSAYPGTIDALVSGSWLEEYDGSSLFPALETPQWVKDNGDYAASLTSGNLPSAATMQLLLFTNLIDKNNNGLNNLLDDTLDAVFGANFEEAAARVEKLTYDDSVSLDKAIVDAFGLTEIFEGDIVITKVEMDLLIASMRLVKATLEWINAYDWNTDLNFLKVNWINNEDIPGSLLDRIGASSLPLKNNFLKDRNNGQMNASKQDFIAAIDAAINAYDNLDKEQLIPQGTKDEITSRLWIKDGLTALKDAINGGQTFWIPDAMPTVNGWNYSEANAFIGVNMGNLFAPGHLSIDKIIDNANGAPTLYGFRGEGEPVAISAKADIANYDAFGFKIKTGQLIGDGGVAKINGMEIPAEYAPSLFPAAIAEALWDLYH
jgi:chitodextrinase